ncbi:hypothetical protein LTR99_004420 [Exophiala xenobiotica]|uniref:Cytochrome P450 n=1 Tax=Vermiconidia calcicola TaxID=1690605 RepID=A0AAV9QCI8_9PEZI|nr:hypothetical protein LTR92_000165 [Exophiala xenobiotica]KAK5539700.1 hypothetical protein LTR25_003405 [Vermiconidia calcicola]KAK5541787.1 hypothetical protein LTR23_005638 [Chaetothyriales sp. CCFEE 6169]KAK5210793.1 hypothetical protein LTR41_003405 [Exophiala xenobiotica]KAK5224878.1 hypothetical protein LTR72_004659 [Exophiala xenobiotica]
MGMLSKLPLGREIFARGSIRPVCLIAALLAFVYLLTRSIYLLWYHSLSEIPGPTVAKLTTWWQSYYASQLKKAEQVQAAHLKYGDIVRIGPNEISFSNPKYLKAIYGHNVPVLKTEFYLGGKFSVHENIFSMRHREEHAARRKLMARNFAQTTLIEMAPSLLRKAQALCHKLEEYEGRTANVYPWLHRLGLEYIFMLTLGRDPQLTETDTHHHALRNLEVFPQNFALSSIFPFLKVHGVSFPVRSIREPFQIQAGWNTFCLEIVAQERNMKPDERAPWIARLMDRDDDFLRRRMTDVEIAEEIIGALFAGSGTTTSTLAYLIYEVVANPNVYQSLKKELQEAIPDWPAGTGSPPPIDLLQHLPYLNAVISESLRSHPTIPGAMPRRIVSDRLKIGALELPRGIIVGAQNYSLHANEEYFPDPTKFDPERFLGMDQSKAKEGLNAFSSGPRGCIGRSLAMLEMQIVAALFFRYFDVKMDPTMKADDMKMRIAFSGNPAGEKVLLNLQKVTS